ncbi:MAG: hypothetical protein KBB94_01890 [Legionellaceae bacterium]|nr:hypothetical protein [Legionellaceae bacterium]MBP9774842.1 hypothetical protein [Legionellaceae bacterium]
MKKTSIIRLAIGCLMLYQIGTSQAGTLPNNRAPLANVSVSAVPFSTTLLRVTVTLNGQLPADHEYNMGIFFGGRAVMSSCENYPQFNGCYFPNVTIASTTTFLLVGDFSDDWHTNRYALLVAFAAPSPESLARPGLGPVLTKDFAGIKAPLQSIATIEYFPFGRISG